MEELIEEIYYPGDEWAEEFDEMFEDFADGVGNWDTDNDVFMSYKGTSASGNRWLLFVWDDGNMVLSVEQGQIITHDRELINKAIEIM